MMIYQIMLTSAFEKMCEANMQIIVVKMTELEMNKDEWMINAYSDEVMG